MTLARVHMEEGAKVKEINLTSSTYHLANWKVTKFSGKKL